MNRPLGEGSRRDSRSARFKVIMSGDDVRRALNTVAQRILERNHGGHDLVLIGIRTRGVPLAKRLADKLKEFEGVDVPVGELDITLYRDDIGMRTMKPLVGSTVIPVDLSGKSVVLVDDVFFTGRTARAALGAIMDYGRPKDIQLAVLVDRGHRELPIEPTYKGKDLPTSIHEEVAVQLRETDGIDSVQLRLAKPALPTQNSKAPRQHRTGL